MKNVFLMACLFLCSWATQAQQKIGYISSDELIASMPEAKKASEEIEKLTKSYQDQLVAMQKEMETKYKAYEAGVKTMTEAMRDVKEKELQDLQKRMESTSQTAQDKIAAKREELLKPITDKADKAIQAVAKSKGYTMVFDSSAGGLVYATDADNLIEAVKAQLGIKATATTPQR
ncbi:MAG: OmpH family outer membrane protein [Chitinophagaceae bacterium]